MPYSLATRKFVFSSFRIYDTLVRSSEIRSGSTLALTKISRDFREQLAILLDDIDMLDSHQQTPQDADVEKDSLESQYEMTSSIITTWHLCEVFYLGSLQFMSIETAVWLKVRVIFY